MGKRHPAGLNESPRPTYYRHRNDDFKHEIVVRAHVPGEGDLWRFTVSGDEAAFDPCIVVRVRTDEFAAFKAFPAFFQALNDRQPGTLDETAALLGELGVSDDTAGFERRRAESNAAWAPDDDSWPHL